MKAPAIQWDLLPEHVTPGTFFEKVLAQLNKDFQAKVFRVGQRPEELNAQLLFNLVRPQVQQCLRNDRAKLMQWFYRVDLNEQQLNDALALGCEDDIVDELTALVIQREVQKVYIRVRWNAHDV